MTDSSTKKIEGNCKVCNHSMKTHNKTIHGPDGSPGPHAGKICLVSVGIGPMGFDMSCSCNGEKAEGLRIMKSWGLKAQ